MTNWIHVDDRLPEERKWVLVWRQMPKDVYKSGMSPVVVLYHDRGHFTDGRYDMDSIYEITHWRPLPPGPDETDGGE